MKLQKIFLSFLALVLTFSSLIHRAPLAKAATFTIVKTSSKPEMYLRLPIGRYKIRNQETWNRWGFDWSMVKLISDAEMNSIPQGPEVSYALRPFNDPTVYVVENGMTRAVTSSEAFTLSGYKWTDITEVEIGLINQLTRGPVLDTPKVVRSPSDGKIYYLWGGQKHHIADADTWNHWGFTGYRETELVNTIPTGTPLTKMVRPYGDPTVWVVDHGKKRALPSPDALILNGYSWSSVVDADAGLIASLPTGDIFWAPTTVQIPGSSTTYYIYDGKRYPIADADTSSNWGFGNYGFNIVAAAANYPLASTVTRLIKTEDGTVWRIKDGVRKAIPSAGVFTGYGFDWNQVSPMPLGALWLLGNGGTLEYTTDTLQGYKIPATSGRTGLEQHIWTNKGESSDTDHYALTNLPTVGAYLDCATRGCIRNGVAGTGSFGRIEPEMEKYYITMRWTYCAWKESTGLDSFGRPATICPDEGYSATSKTWHKYKKVIISNPKNGKKLVAAVGESGPAIWVTREQGVVAGLSPEGVDYLQTKYNTNGDQLEYGWSVDQTLPLGPLNW